MLPGAHAHSPRPKPPTIVCSRTPRVSDVLSLEPGRSPHPAPRCTAAQDEAIAQALGLGRQTLSESESKQLLAAWGVGSAREHRATSAEAAVAAAEQLGFPVALKVDSPNILHKTEA